MKKKHIKSLHNYLDRSKQMSFDFFPGLLPTRVRDIMGDIKALHDEGSISTYQYNKYKQHNDNNSDKREARAKERINDLKSELAEKKTKKKKQHA